jgi:hypothetical protein
LCLVADQSPFCPSADKRVGKVTDCAKKNEERHHMLREQTAVFDPEELSLLSNILDRAVATLPPAMQTPANRMKIAKIILTSAASGEIALAPLMEDARVLLAASPPRRR